ncbi:MAG: diguanylate cyclase [Pseudomonadota bacterium]
MSAKLIGYVLASVLITSVVVGVVRVQNERGSLGELIDRAGMGVATATASGAASLVAGYDYGNLEILARNVARQPDVIRVGIRNLTGRVMSEAAGEAAGTYKRYEAPIVFDSQTIGSVSVDISTKTLENALAALYWRVFIEQAVFGLILGVIVYVFTAGGIVSPILRLTRAMEDAVANDDGFVARDLEVKSRDEIGRLVSVFNRMNRALVNYHSQLRSRIDFANRELQEKNIQLAGRTRELEHALDMLSAMATTDWLTELPNRRKFDETLSRMFHQSERFLENISLVLFDVDYFKQINDSHGHGAGDQVLRDIGTLLRLHVRKSDLPARLGGDEFGIILYHTNAEQALVFVESLLRHLQDYVFEYDGFRLEIGFSVGIAQYDASMNAPRELYFAADRALYQSKRDGRGRCSVHVQNPANEEKQAS